MSNYAITQGLNEQAKAQADNATAQGDAFDKAKNDDTFYLPPEAFKTRISRGVSSSSYRRTGTPSG